MEMDIGFKQSTFFPKQSNWEVVEARRAKMKARASSFQSQANTLASALSTTISFQIEGYGQNAIKTAVDRLNAQAAKTQEEFKTQSTDFFA